MADGQARRAGRGVAEGDVEAEARAIAARLRAGQHRETDVQLAAWLGHPAARLVLGAGFDPRPEWWDEEVALEHWIMYAGMHAGVWPVERGDGPAGSVTAFLTPDPADRRAETFYLTAILCTTGYWLCRMALLEQRIAGAVEEGNLVTHEDPPGWFVNVDLQPPSGVAFAEHLTGLGYLDEDVHHAVTDVHQRALEAMHPDYARLAPWRWRAPDFWFPEGDGYIPMMALCTCGHQYQSHARNDVGDDVCEECSCIRWESSGQSACGTFPTTPRRQPEGYSPNEMPAYDAATYFAAEAERLVYFREPVRERLRANLCFWAIGSHTPAPRISVVRQG